MKTYFEIDEERLKSVEEVNLSRYSTKKPNEKVLETLSGRCFIEKGVSKYKFSLSTKKLLLEENREVFSTAHVMVKGRWYSSEEADQNKIKRSADKSANVFDGMGVLTVPEDFKIPIVMANEENVKFYGLSLIPDGDYFPVISHVANTLLMEYNYKPNYETDFLTRDNGGGGYYVEKHDFPHIHIPLSRTSRGYIIIGKNIDPFNYCFTAFEIPYGYALYSPPGTIHGDGTLIGKYAISVANSEAVANTVLFFNELTLTKKNTIF